MLGVQVSLGTVRARKLSIGILLWDLALGLGRSRSRRGGPAWGAGQDSSPTLRPDHVCGLFALGHHRRLRHQWALAIGRVHSRLGNDSTGRHRAKGGRGPTAGRGRSRSDRLGMRRRSGGLRQHGRRSAGVRLLRVRVVAHNGIGAAASRVLRRRGWVARHGARGGRRAGRCRGPRNGGIVTVGRLLHSRVAGLQWRQSMRRGCRGLLLVVIVVRCYC